LTCAKGKFTEPCGTDGYITPQIEEKKPFLGEAADLFAAAVSLMIMRNGKPPFNSATKSDALFKKLAMNRADLYWRNWDRFNT